ncbi:hypothetical protein B0J11DRAFT_522474 [Dendryphion nanum]|uniref:Uncharacterized protein n=1 Tax=Dendryphion nanum TaxID=256645 RepID=A0A9P9E3R2_9PLEO|nr:hypothetical protein B0J11DRAFT_522474 [Dendryphion nanum]
MAFNIVTFIFVKDCRSHRGVDISYHVYDHDSTTSTGYACFTSHWVDDNVEHQNNRLTRQSAMRYVGIRNQVLNESEILRRERWARELRGRDSRTAMQTGVTTDQNFVESESPTEPVPTVLEQSSISSTTNLTQTSSSSCLNPSSPKSPYYHDPKFIPTPPPRIDSAHIRDSLDLIRRSPVQDCDLRRRERRSWKYKVKEWMRGAGCYFFC